MEIIKQKIINNCREILDCEINKNGKLTKKYTILILHALTGNKENKTINFLAKNIPTYGYPTILFDFSGHGKSEGKLEEATVSKQLEDIKIILDKIKKVNTKKIIIIGNSFSVITALAFSINNPVVKGLILLSGRAKYLDYIKNLEIINGKYKIIEDKFIDKSFIEDYKKYNPLENIMSLNIPVLIIHGDKDETVPVSNAHLFYEKSLSKKKFLKIIKGANHKYSDIKFKEKVLNEIKEYLDKL